MFVCAVVYVSVCLDGYKSDKFPYNPISLGTRWLAFADSKVFYLIHASVMYIANMCTTYIQ